MKAGAPRSADDDLREQIRKASRDNSPAARLGRMVGAILNLVFIVIFILAMPTLFGLLFFQSAAYPQLNPSLQLLARWFYGLPMVGGLMAYLFLAYYMISRTIRP